MPSAPLARDRDGSPVELPQGAEGFLVRRLPSARGGRPGVVLYEGAQLCVAIDTTAEQLRELAGEGRYRLDVVDQEMQPLGCECWITVGPAPSAAASSTSSTAALPRTAAEAALIDSMRILSGALVESQRANSELMKAFADRVRGTAPAPIIAAAAEEQDSEGRIMGMTVPELVQLAPAVAQLWKGLQSPPAPKKDAA